MDAVLESERGAWAVEVKTGSYSFPTWSGCSFCRRYPKFRPVSSPAGGRSQPDIPGVARVSWVDFLSGRSPLDVA